MQLRHCLLSVVLLACTAGVGAETPLEASVNELRHVIGEWNVITEEINPDGSIARALDGTYSFEWVIPDRIVAGRAEAPAIDRLSALLFYVSETQDHIEWSRSRRTAGCGS